MRWFGLAVLGLICGLPWELMLAGLAVNEVIVGLVATVTVMVVVAVAEPTAFFAVSV